MTAGATALLAAMGYANATLYRHWLDWMVGTFAHGFAEPLKDNSELLALLSQGLPGLVAEYAGELDPATCAMGSRPAPG